jgi:hypothetical protein
VGFKIYPRFIALIKFILSQRIQAGRPILKK